MYDDYCSRMGYTGFYSVTLTFRVPSDRDNVENLISIIPWVKLLVVICDLQNRIPLVTYFGDQSNLCNVVYIYIV